ncbi:MAG: Eco57I restriction-modification methylase domain-containing protein [Flavobacteriaceae bacterium]|nr:Eco57I restriction-modification methylase domain-containing protein [Flavobacteriaceae bacterium]
MNKKETGSYYTPKTLSDFLVNHIFDKYMGNTNLHILEPSCGDGQFLSSLKEKNIRQQINIEILDIDKGELEKATNILTNLDNIQTNSYHQDYLEYFIQNDNRYSLIIGNPPYIKKKNMQDKHIKICEKIHEKAKIYNKKIESNGSIKNIWPAFVKAAVMSLEETGVLCFVIPAEILQVKYAKELRAFIVDEFDRVEVFAFNELIFEGIQQDVVAIIGAKGVNDANEHGFSFYQVETLKDLKEPRFTEKHSNIHRTTLDKWTNYILTDSELNHIADLASKSKTIKEYTSKAEVGIVSAANDYFIIDDKTLKENKLNRYRSIIKPILPKGYVVPNVGNFTSNDFNALKNNDKRVNFLHFPNVVKNKLSKTLNKYLTKGEEQNLHKRYKMTKRENWYHVPTVWKSEALFVKRSHVYPKIFVNEADVYATDSFYRVNTKKEYSIKNLIFSFYNSLTFILAELEGRYYGGGVLELTPNEFKNLAIPYNENISEEQFSTLDKMLRYNTDIETILAYTNPILLKNVDLNKLETIRQQLVFRRMKKKIEKEEKQTITLPKAKIIKKKKEVVYEAI